MPDSANLRCIALARINDPLNTWPDHNNYHRRTILGNWIDDEHCLRCHLEIIASQQIREKSIKQEPCNGTNESP